MGKYWRSLRAWLSKFTCKKRWISANFHLSFASYFIALGGITCFGFQLIVRILELRSAPRSLRKVGFSVLLVSQNALVSYHTL
jgi:hypothetical protein